MLRFVTSSPKACRGVAQEKQEGGELSRICDCEHAAAEKMTEGTATVPP